MTQLTRTEARIVEMEAEKAALEAQSAARGGIAEFGEGSHRVRYESGAALEKRIGVLRNKIETDKSRVIALGGSL